MRRLRAANPVDDPADVDAAEATALRVLGGAAQSAVALQRRLQQRGYSMHAAKEAVQRCRDLGYVDDSALAESVATRHRRSHHGRARIVADLRARGVDSETIATATATLADSELDAAIAAARTLHARIASDGFDDRAWRKLAAALQRRGFSGDVIVRALRALDSGDG